MASLEHSPSESEGELHLSASSSSFEESGGSDEGEVEELREEADAVAGAAPYQFEPLVEDLPRQGEAAAQPEAKAAVQRLNNLNWCLCGECSLMATERESLCCREIPKVGVRRDEEHEAQCITQHVGFSPICLNVHVLLVAYLQYRQQYGERQGHQINGHAAEQGVAHAITCSHGLPTLRRRLGTVQYRYTAYRQFVRWCWGFLGRHVRVVLPSCVVRRIRDAFPAAEYAGFQYPNLN